MSNMSSSAASSTPSSPGTVSLPPKFNLSSQAHNYDRASLPTTYIWTREYAGGKVLASEPVYLDQGPPHSVFERALHTVAMKIRRPPTEAVDSIKCRQWQEDMKNVHAGTCSFQVQYLGSVDVAQSKGIQVCEDVIKSLKTQESRGSQKKEDRLTGSNHLATMHITSEAITVIDDETQNVLCEDTIQSISYCAAHRRREKCFAYISRSSPRERQYTCHAFSALTATGERLSHAVGCAFDACHGKLNAVDESNAELNSSEAEAGAFAGAHPTAGPSGHGRQTADDQRDRQQASTSSSREGAHQAVNLAMHDM
jgi:hypothetical protein